MKKPKQTRMSFFGPGDTEISTTRAAAMLRCSDQTIRDKIECNIIVGIRPWPGGQWKISKKSVEAVIESMERQKRGEEPPPFEGK